MKRDVADYVALALVRNRDQEATYGFGTPGDFSGDMEELRAHAAELCGFNVSDEILNRSLRTLADCGLLRVTEDPYSGTFVKVKTSLLQDFFQRADSEFERARTDDDELGLVSKPSDYPAATALMKHELLEDYRELGSDWLTRALKGLGRTLGPEGLIEDDDAQLEGLELPSTAPASDRIVTLDHNQQGELEAASTDVIEAVEKENAIDGDSSLRQLVLGQLRAGRELIRAQTLSAYLLYETLFAALSRLINRYKGHAIGITAAKLLELLIEHVFGK